MGYRRRKIQTVVRLKNGTVVTKVDGQFKCPTCTKNYVKAQNLQKHFRDCHHITEENESNDSTESLATCSSKEIDTLNLKFENGYIMCTTCESLIRRTNIARHIRLVHKCPMWKKALEGIKHLIPDVLNESYLVPAPNAVPPVEGKEFIVKFRN
jgi:predicted RNA-binding Zn-ribbon protein involved in translation (DUF1610 family)